ncbi:MAG: hypothetical protein ACYDHB_06960 [Candidatus Dormibacteria bacterium]
MSGSNTAATQAVQALLQHHLGERPQGMWNPGRRGGTRVYATRRWLIASVASFCHLVADDCSSGLDSGDPP